MRRLPHGVKAELPGQAADPNQCWADRPRLDAYGKPLPAGICPNRAATPLLLCEAHHTEIVGRCWCDFDPSSTGGLCDVCGLPEWQGREGDR